MVREEKGAEEVQLHDTERRDPVIVTSRVMVEERDMIAGLLQGADPALHHATVRTVLLDTVESTAESVGGTSLLGVIFATSSIQPELVHMERIADSHIIPHSIFVIAVFAPGRKVAPVVHLVSTENPAVQEPHVLKDLLAMTIII